MKELGALVICTALAACGAGTHLPDSDAGKEASHSAGHKKDAGAGRVDASSDAASDGPDAGVLPSFTGCRMDLDCAQNDVGGFCDLRRSECVECVSDGQCEKGERCIQRECVDERTCNNSLDCSLGAVCSDELGLCVECTADADCAPSGRCAGTHCQPKCDSDKDCTAFQMLCDFAAGYCKPDKPSSNEPAEPADAGVGCSDMRIAASRVLPTVMFVVDGSSSMEMPYGQSSADGGASSTTRWSAVRYAIIDPDNGVIRALAGLARFGLAIFGTNATCPLPVGVVPPAADNADALMSAWPTTPPGMFTPTGPALDQIVDMLPDPTTPGVAPQIIVLATDGEPNACNVDIFTGIVTDYAPSIAAAMKAQSKHLKILVVSVADAAGEFADHLQQMANIGAGLPQTANPGAPVHYPKDIAELTSTLMDSLTPELPCEVELGVAVAAGSECDGSVVLNGSELPCHGDDGWELVDSTHIVLNGNACDVFREPDANIEASFPCSTRL